MIRNPFLDRAADARIGSMAEERNFVGLFGVSSLDLISEQMQHIWERPLLMISAPGGGKSSLMRIFSPTALRYVEETAHIGKERQALFDKLTELGAMKQGHPFALGIWLRLSDEYRSLETFSSPNKHGLFYAMLNARIILSALNGICVLNDLVVSKDLRRVALSLRDNSSAATVSNWAKWGAPNAQALYDNMATLEADLSGMIDNPFWDGDPSNLSNSGLWSLDLLANLGIAIGGRKMEYRPLVMLDDIHELSPSQIHFLLGLLMSRQLNLPFWVSARKQALGLEELLTNNLMRGVQKERDYVIIDFENSKAGFRRRVLEISKLRVQSVAAQIGGSSQAFDDFISDEREEIFLKNLDMTVAEQIKERILKTAGAELGRFQGLISRFETQYQEPHDRCRRLRMLEILVNREMGKSQRSFSFLEISGKEFSKHENDQAIVAAAELFFAKECKLPYYFGSPRLIAMSSFNIDQFLRLAGALFYEILTAIRLERDRDSFVSPERQDQILKKAAKSFMDDIPSMVPNGVTVRRLVQSIGEMCRHETYRATASYAPGVTGTAITVHEFESLRDQAHKGNGGYSELYEAIESSIDNNIFESEPYYKCKGQEFLVLYLNRLLCVPFDLPLQRGGFREQKLSTLLSWSQKGYHSSKMNQEQWELW